MSAAAAVGPEDVRRYGAPVPDRPFDAVVFDFSGVLVTSAFDVLASVLGDQLPKDDALELLLGPYDEDTDHPWHRVERGEIGMGEWVSHINTIATERNLTVDWASMSAAFGELQVQEVIVDRVRSLRSDGYRTALLTNNVKEGSDTWRALIPVDELFDVVVDSSAVGMRKPDPRIYLHTLELLGGVEPARAVFLDDHPGNVAGAQAAGLAAIVVADPADAVAELDALLTAMP